VQLRVGRRVFCDLEQGNEHVLGNSLGE
jgi:hypothetical protein